MPNHTGLKGLTPRVIRPQARAMISSTRSRSSLIEPALPVRSLSGSAPGVPLRSQHRPDGRAGGRGPLQGPPRREDSGRDPDRSGCRDHCLPGLPSAPRIRKSGRQNGQRNQQRKTFRSNPPRSIIRYMLEHYHVSKYRIDGILWCRGIICIMGIVRRMSSNLHHKGHTDHIDSVPSFLWVNSRPPGTIGYDV